MLGRWAASSPTSSTASGQGHLIEDTQILPLEDGECSDTVARATSGGSASLPGCKVVKAEVGKKVTLTLEAGRKSQTVEAEKVLMAAGRAVNTENMGFKESGVELTGRGFVKINRDTLETTAGVYCIGDVAGPDAGAQGEPRGVIVTEIIAGQHHHPIRYDNIPSVTYCHPEVASIGLTEEQSQGEEARLPGGRPFSANGRARASSRDRRVREDHPRQEVRRDPRRAHRRRARLEMIHELAVARENTRWKRWTWRSTPHPTLSEAVAEAALDSMGRVMHI
ncbi:MAG: FAD-dependent oxidoreductase [Gemmatimonadales bacterium]